MVCYETVIRRITYLVIAFLVICFLAEPSFTIVKYCQDYFFPESRSHVPTHFSSFPQADDAGLTFVSSGYSGEDLDASLEESRPKRSVGNTYAMRLADMIGKRLTYVHIIREQLPASRYETIIVTPENFNGSSFRYCPSSIRILTKVDERIARFYPSYLVFDAYWERKSDPTLLRYHLPNESLSIGVYSVLKERELQRNWTNNMPPIWYDPDIPTTGLHHQKRLPVYSHAGNHQSRSGWFQTRDNGKRFLHNRNLNPETDLGLFTCSVQLTPTWSHVLVQIWVVQNTIHSRGMYYDGLKTQGMPKIRAKSRLLFKRAKASSKGAMKTIYQMVMKCDVSSYPMEFQPTQFYWSPIKEWEGDYDGHRVAMNYVHPGNFTYDSKRLMTGHIVDESNRRNSLPPYEMDLYMQPFLGQYGVPIFTLSLSMNLTTHDWYRLAQIDFRCEHHVPQDDDPRVVNLVNFRPVTNEINMCFNEQGTGSKSSEYGTCYVPYFKYKKGTLRHGKPLQ